MTPNDGNKYEAAFNTFTATQLIAARCIAK